MQNDNDSDNQGRRMLGSTPADPENEIPSTDPQPMQTPTVAGSRIIQPLSENIVIDPIAPPEAQPPHSEATKEHMPPEEHLFDPTTSNLPYTYTPTVGMTNLNPDTAVAVSQMQSRNKTTKKIIIAVRVLGALMIIVSVLSLTSSFQSDKSAHGSSVILIVLSIAEILLSIGILVRRELARRIYVVLAMISLIFTAYSTFTYFNYTQNINQAADTIMAKAEKNIALDQNNKSLSESQRSKLINEQQATEVKYQQLASKAINAATLSIVLLWVTSLAPLVFLTRSRVKEVFN